uniref:hypothetical protein n=1 Tax=Streptomyces asoensis TaxID=249586 RepID=UPI00209BE65A|nr:hypothetical protein [Streptomyces asoensis]
MDALRRMLRPLLRNGGGTGAGLGPDRRTGRLPRPRPGARGGPRPPRDPGRGRRSLVRPRAPARPGRLEPQTGWAMGNAGIARELLCHVRLGRGGDPRYAFTWPDQPAVRGAAAQATEPIRPVGTEAVS